MQHFYNTHIFKTTMESLREEDVQSDVDVNYFDNDPIIELLSSHVGIGDVWALIIAQRELSNQKTYYKSN